LNAVVREELHDARLSVTADMQFACMHARQAAGVQPPDGKTPHVPIESQYQT
jgi:hypothetical protein